MRQFITSVLALTILTVPGAMSAQEVGLPVGTTVEPVMLETLAGEDVDLGQYLGTQPLFIQFWASWCEQCEALEPKVIAAHDQFGDRVKFIAVAVAVNQSKRSVQRHLDRNHLPFEFLWDGRGRGVRAFKAPTTSYVVVVNAQGSVVYTGVGVDQEFDEALSQVTSEPTGS